MVIAISLQIHQQICQSFKTSRWPDVGVTATFRHSGSGDDRVTPFTESKSLLILSQKRPVAIACFSRPPSL
ncbi:Deacetylase [Frankliniella fusca]|uniref:Deacetylase n=1 Tax=Frankliniella fusca TaxID=407009 RepID=A0AAE1HQ01_9NEOP|nr:Deacetylase [Frankliniella fusca]